MKKIAQEWMVLYATDPYYLIESLQEFSARLSDLQLIGDPLAAHAGRPRFAPGPLFMERLVFTGCAPSVNSPDGAAAYNQYDLELVISKSEPLFVTGTSSRAPECPQCKENSGQQLIETRIISDQGLCWLCPLCGAHIPIGSINFKRKACIASSMIFINGVHEGEVVPSDELLTELQSYSGVTWSYCYCRGRA